MRRLLQIDPVLTDRGLRYAITGRPVTGRADLDGFLADLKRAKRYARATHNSWAAILSEEGV